VTKLAPAGSALVYSTYLGGAGDDHANGIAVDGAGSAYVTGVTNSINFPTQSPYQAALSGSPDAFVTKLTPTGNALVYSTYLGGAGDDQANGIAVDGAGSAYVTGLAGDGFPTQSPYQAIYPGFGDPFVTKMTPAGNALVYSTYLGGGGIGYGIAVDSAGSAYITGTTGSGSFPTQSPYQATNQGFYDAFVTKMTPAGNALVYSTYLGGSSYDTAQGIAVDGAGAAYIIGFIQSTNFPTQSPYQATFQGATEDAFVTKLPSFGTTSSVTLSMADGSGTPGRAVEVPIQLASTGTASTTAFQADLNFDQTKLTFVSSRAGAQLTSANKSLATNVLPNNDVRLLASGFNQNTISNGVVAYATFTLSPLFTTGSSTVSLKNCASSDALSNVLLPACIAGTIRPFSCDINGDGTVNVSDVQLVINEALGVSPAVHDLNHDGVVNVADVQKEINAALGLGCPY
jgi:hypothetical protein